MDKTCNIFISHFSKDDKQVQSFKQRLKEAGYLVRNSSVDSTKYQEHRPSNHFIAKKLRMLIKWSGTFICLIGESTHTRPWVNFEITQAHKQGKRIIGIYKYGCKDTAELPEAYKKYGSKPYGWNSIEKIGDILLGDEVPEEIPEETPGQIPPQSPFYPVVRIKCN